MPKFRLIAHQRITHEFHVEAPSEAEAHKRFARRHALPFPIVDRKGAAWGPLVPQTVEQLTRDSTQKAGA